MTYTEIMNYVIENPLISGCNLAKKFGMSNSTANRYLKKIFPNRPKNQSLILANKKRVKSLIITENAHQIIIGSLLGDGSMVAGSSTRLVINHSTTQKEYALYKKDLLEKENVVVYFRERNSSLTERKIKDRVLKDNGYVTVETVKTPDLVQYRESFYPFGKRTIPIITETLNALGLAIWFMDDGSKNVSSYYLCSLAYTEDENKYLQKILLDNFNIKTSLHKNYDKYSIYVKAESRTLFTSIVKPYVCESMSYKLFI